MAPYIVNLTDYLITKYRFDRWLIRDFSIDNGSSMEDFSSSVGDYLLYTEDVMGSMTPEQLGVILCSFPTYIISKEVTKGAYKGCHFLRSCDNFTRDLAAYYLGFIILQRLKGDHHSIPPWKPPIKIRRSKKRTRKTTQR
jgi:hypothetical protein